LEQQIGSGAMGVVWRAIDERLQRTVAVKQLLLQPGYTDEETEEARQRSMREGRIAARLQHQNAIAVFDVAEDRGQPVLVMEYLPSQSLAGMLAEQGPLPAVSVARIGAQVAAALAAAHRAGIVHRDLKPGNVLLGENGVAKITDFGISRAIGDVSVTKSGILAGTPAYLSPEVALGRDPAPASDVFSLGATLYAAIEGGPPFGQDDNAISLLHRVAQGHVDPPRQAGPMTPALMQLLRADPVDRPTMSQVRGMLQAVVDGQPVPSFPTTSQQPPVRAQQPAQQPQAPMPGPAQPAWEGSGGTAFGPATQQAPRTQMREPVQPAPPRRRRRSGRGVLMWVVAVVLAALVGVVVANTASKKFSDGAPADPAVASQQQPQAGASSPSEVRPASAQPAKSGGTSAESRTTQTVKKYFTLVPHHLDQSWSLLGPGLKAMGEERYQDFWDDIDDVKVVGEPRAVGNTVHVNLLYSDHGRRTLEKHVLGMVTGQNGQPLINSDQLSR
jgi:serine/threonine protein kinase